MKNNHAPKQSTEKLSITVLLISAFAMVISLILVINSDNWRTDKINPDTQTNGLIKENIVGKYATSITTTAGKQHFTLTLESTGAASLEEVSVNSRIATKSGTWQIADNSSKVVVDIAQQTPLQFVYTNTTPSTLQYQTGGELNWQPSLMLIKQESIFAYKWQWLSTLDKQQKVVFTPPENVFGLVFSQDGRLAISTDCNSATGSFSLNGQKISFSEIASTLKYCPDSKEIDFYDQLKLAKSYQLDNQRLKINLSNGQEMHFAGVNITD